MVETPENPLKIPVRTAAAQKRSDKPFTGLFMPSGKTDSPPLPLRFRHRDASPVQLNPVDEKLDSSRHCKSPAESNHHQQNKIHLGSGAEDTPPSKTHKTTAPFISPGILLHNLRQKSASIIREHFSV